MRSLLLALAGLLAYGTAWAEEPGAAPADEPVAPADEPKAPDESRPPDDELRPPGNPLAAATPPAETCPGCRPKHALVTGALSIGIPLAVVPTVLIVDALEFEARGASRTALHALGWTAIAGVFVGPTLGSLYAGAPLWNTGSKIRGAGTLVMGGGILIAATDPNKELSVRALVAMGVVTAGLVTYGVGWISESTIAFRATARHNARLQEPTSRVGLVPVVGATEIVPGIGWVGTF